MGDIVDIKKYKPKLEVWSCNCGSVAFVLYNNGKVKCAECDTLSDYVYCNFGLEAN